MKSFCPLGLLVLEHKNRKAHSKDVMNRKLYLQVGRWSEDTVRLSSLNLAHQLSSRGTHIIHNSSWLCLPLFLPYHFHIHYGKNCLDVTRCQRSSLAKYDAPVGGMVAHYSLLESSTHQGQEPRRVVNGYTAVLKQWPRVEEAQSRKSELRCQWETWYKLNSCAAKGTYQHLLCCSPQSPVTRDPLWELKGQLTCQIIWHKIRVDAKYFIAKKSNKPIEFSVKS